MKPALFRIEALTADHDRSLFHCGNDALDRYLQTQATQDIRRRIANCFVGVETSSGRIAAYYTLSATSIPIGEIPPESAKRLPRYPVVPAVRIGRLAVDQRFQRRGLGEALPADAAARVLRADIAAFMLVADAKDDRAVAFYRRYGFREIAGQPRKLFLSLATAQQVLLSSSR